MQELRDSLTVAFDTGYVPENILEVMQSNGNDGRVWLLDEENGNRIGVGYQTMLDGLVKQKYMFWYTPEEATLILKDYNERT